MRTDNRIIGDICEQEIATFRTRFRGEVVKVYNNDFGLKIKLTTGTVCSYVCKMCLLIHWTPVTATLLVLKAF